jgi:glutamyl-tRNA synthetase
MMETVKTRFAPSPTGSLHVGGARTALFSHAIARKFGGQFLLRIEDTDRERHQEDAVEKIQKDLRWLGLEWDEGIGIGGGHGPYRQSERLEIYREHIETLVRQGKAYYAFETAEELDAMREDAQVAGKGFVYPRPATLPTEADADVARAEGRPVVVRFLCPGHDVTIQDEVFGEVTIPAAEMDDFIIAKADGWPTYHLANVVDDALMGITFILRGQEFLGQTWRQVLLREALGFLEPRYAHLPLILDMQGRKLSKRDGAVEVESFRRDGYLPEALVNFLALLGWSPTDERDRFSLDEFIQAFDVSRIGKSNAKFDREKLLAFNTDAAAEKSPEQLAPAFAEFLRMQTDEISQAIPADNDAVLTKLLEACKGFRTFRDVVAKAGVLFGPNDNFEYDQKAVKKVLQKNDDQGYAVLAQLLPLLEKTDFTPEALRDAIQTFCQEHEIGMGKVAQPLRVATTGGTVSPGIGETLELLGRDKTLARIRRCLATRD